jgi:hypothetical protein
MGSKKAMSQGRTVHDDKGNLHNEMIKLANDPYKSKALAWKPMLTLHIPLTSSSSRLELMYTEE